MAEDVSLVSDMPRVDIPNDMLTPMQKAEKLMKLTALKKDIDGMMDELRADLLKTMTDLDVLTLKTGSYTITRQKRITPQVIDYKTVKKALEERGIPIVVREVFGKEMDVVFKQMIEQGEQLEGLEARITEYPSIRLTKKEA